MITYDSIVVKLGGKNNVLIDGAPALLDSSKLCCNWRGQISIEDCGQ